MTRVWKLGARPWDYTKFAKKFVDSAKKHGFIAVGRARESDIQVTATDETRKNMKRKWHDTNINEITRLWLFAAQIQPKDILLLLLHMVPPKLLREQRPKPKTSLRKPDSNGSNRKLNLRKALV